MLTRKRPHRVALLTVIIVQGRARALAALKGLSDSILVRAAASVFTRDVAMTGRWTGAEAIDLVTSTLPSFVGLLLNYCDLC